MLRPSGITSCQYPYLDVKAAIVTGVVITLGRMEAVSNQAVLNSPTNTSSDSLRLSTLWPSIQFNSGYGLDLDDDLSYMLSRVEVVKSCWRLFERENPVHEWSKGNLLLVQELVQAQIIILRASSNTPRYQLSVRVPKLPKFLQLT